MRSSSRFTIDHDSDDMRFFFEDCIDEVIDLIQGQITQIDNKKNSRVKVRISEAVLQLCDDRSSQFF